MEKVRTFKEAPLSKRRNRASAQQVIHNPQIDNTISIDSYRPHKQRPIHLTPKTLSQESYIDLLTDPKKIIVFATGPAGTGKTMLAVLAALQAFRAGECSKIVITRPAVGVDDEKHGFLPGDLNAKMEPWTRPIIDYVQEYYRPVEVTKMLEEQQIEISPLAYMRGRTFKNAWIIADEMQNATPSQMKMLLTRLGEGSKIVVTGDTRQADRNDADNGLLDFKRLVESYRNCQYVSGVEFTGRDVMRHPAVLEVLKIYKGV